MNRRKVSFVPACHTRGLLVAAQRNAARIGFLSALPRQSLSSQEGICVTSLSSCPIRIMCLHCSRREKKSFAVPPGAIVELLPHEPRTLRSLSLQDHEEVEQLRDLNPPLQVLYEDKHIIMVNKPPGLLSHPSGHERNRSVAHSLVLHHGVNYETWNSDEYSYFRSGIVHRLDRDTSGVMVAGKTRNAAKQLAESFAERNVSKSYVALCAGKAPPLSHVDVFMGRDRAHRGRMKVIGELRERGRVFTRERSGGTTERDSKFAKRSISHLHRIASNDVLSLVYCVLETGRTHQIRLHCQHAGIPVIGDPIYGIEAVNAAVDVHRQLLHAWRLAVVHPVRDEVVNVVSTDVPADMGSLMTESGFTAEAVLEFEKTRFRDLSASEVTGYGDYGDHEDLGWDSWMASDTDDDWDDDDEHDLVEDLKAKLFRRTQRGQSQSEKQSTVHTEVVYDDVHFDAGACDDGDSSADTDTDSDD